MNPAAYDTDPMLRLLTDALRRGPGSPEWHDAVTRLRDAEGADADEYRLLVAARERLESGRQYREVRAGPAFTRELFGALHGEPAGGRRINTALVVRLLALLVLAGVVGVVVMSLARPGRPSAQQLGGRLFVTHVHDWAFTSIPADLRADGPLPLEARGGGLRAGGRDTTEPTVGRLVADDALDLARGTCVEMRLDFKPGPTSAALCLTAPREARQDTDALEQELAVVCDAAGVRLTTPTASTVPRPLPAGSHLLRIKVVGDDAVAEVDGQAIWTGKHPLGAQAFVGVRLTRTGKSGDVTVRSLRVLAP